MLAKNTMLKSSINVILERGTLRIVPKHAQRIFCFFSKLSITPKLENPIMTIVAREVAFGNQEPKYKMPKLSSKKG